MDSKKTKICTDCKKSKTLSNFSKNNRSSDGYLNTCFDCLALRKQSRGSLRKAIDAKCKECIYDPYSGEGTWREQVEKCTSGACPLFSMRPVSENFNIKFNK